MIADLEGTFDDAGLPGSDIPDGNYQVKILSAELNYSSNKRPQCSWQLQIANGEFVNRRLFKHDGVDNEQSIGFFKLGLQRLGVEVKSMRQLPAELKELVGTCAEVRVQTKGEFTNTHFTKALDDDEVETADLEDFGAAAGEGASSEDEDWKAGEKCIVDYDGTPYTGKITRIGDTTATVKFEDGETDEVEFDDLQVPDEPEEGSPATKGGEGEGDPETTVKITFNDEKVTEEQVGTIGKLAKANEFDPDLYEEWADLLADIAEYLGISGTFKTAANLLAAIEKKA